jgi:hypothetical protein
VCVCVCVCVCVLVILSSCYSYFNSQSKAENAVAIVPALVNLNAAVRKLKEEDKKDVKEAIVGGVSASLSDAKVGSLLDRVSTLLLNETRGALTEIFGRLNKQLATASVAEAIAVANKDEKKAGGDDKERSYIEALRDFLARMQVCLLNGKF